MSMSAAEDRKTLAASVPETYPAPVKTRRGFVGEEELPVEASTYHTEGGEVRLDLGVDADWAPEELRELLITAYLDPLAAVQLGERLTESGRKALAALVEGLEDG